MRQGDIIRWSFAPTYWGAGRPSTFIRMSTNNHPGNIIRTLKAFENQFDTFSLTVDPLRPVPTLLMATGLLSTLQLYGPAEFLMTYGDSRFPQPSRSSDEFDTEPVTPPVNQTALLMQLISTLMANSRIRLPMPSEAVEDVDHPRSSAASMVDQVEFAPGIPDLEFGGIPELYGPIQLWRESVEPVSAYHPDVGFDDPSLLSLEPETLDDYC